MKVKLWAARDIIGRGLYLYADEPTWVSERGRFSATRFGGDGFRLFQNDFLKPGECKPVWLSDEEPT